MSIRQGKKLIASSTTNGFSLFDCKWADHILNNISWLRADTFSWQSGDVYVAAYEHLNSDLSNVDKLYCWYGDTRFYTKSETPSVGDTVYTNTGSDTGWTIEEIISNSVVLSNGYSGSRDSANDELLPYTDVIDGTTITYYVAQDGHKICLPDQENNVSAIYSKTGAADYFILDTTNKQFKLPRKQKRRLIQAVNNADGTWYNLYSDGWVEQGGFDAATFNNKTFSFPMEMKDTGYVLTLGYGYGNISGQNGKFGIKERTTTGFSFSVISLSGNATGANMSWNVSGYAAESAYEGVGVRFEYYYVGNYVENATTVDVGKLTEIVNDFDIGAFKPEVDEAKNSAIVDISDAKTDAIDSITNLATDLGTSLKYGNVGDIFYTSRLDVSLNGAVECNGNLYNTTDFSGAQSIGNLLRDSKVPYISLSEHQTTVDTYGSCRCFGWDGGTEFRVPKLADVFIEAGTAESEGEFIAAGLPNITGDIVVYTATSGDNSASGAFEKFNGTGRGESYQYAGKNQGYSFDASRSSSVYGESTTVQPPAVRYRAMVQLAFGATDAAVVAAGNVVADVSMLKNRFFVPDYGNGTILSPNATHTVPSNGYLLIRCNENATTGNITINGTTIALCYLYKASKDIEGGSLSTLPVAKGDVFSTAVRDAWIMFCPVKYV